MNDNERDDLLSARLREQAARAVAKGEIEYTKFLDPREQKLAAAAARDEGSLLILYCSDIPLERRVCAFDGRLWLDDDQRSHDWPVQPLAITWEEKFNSLSHRDILGALMALGISRECIGDISAGEGEAVCFVLESLALYISTNLEKAGSAAVKTTFMQGDLSGLPQPKARQIRETVQSLRLDSLVSAAYNLSREEAARAIRSGLVKLNFEEETRTDRRVDEGAMLSLRGKGRAKLISASGHTKRSGRIILLIDRYI